MADLLVVEDDRDVAWLLEQVLVAEGHRVRVARDGEEGLRLLHERLPEVVITDIEMPVLDGPQMAGRMLLDDCGLEEIPVLLISGFADLDRIAKRIGTPYTLAKPFATRDLVALLNLALTERRPPTPGA